MGSCRLNETVLSLSTEVLFRRNEVGLHGAAMYALRPPASVIATRRCSRDWRLSLRTEGAGSAKPPPHYPRSRLRQQQALLGQFNTRRC